MTAFSTQTTFIELTDDVTSAIGRQFRVQDAGVDSELIEEEFEPVTFVDGINEENRLARDEFEFEESVDEDEFVLFFALELVLDELEGWRENGFLEF